MFNCPKCSAGVNYGAKYCEHCGCEMNWDNVNSQVSTGSGQTNAGNGEKWSVLSILGFALSLVMGGIITLVLSIIGLNECKNKGYKGRGFAIAGIVISSIYVALSIVLVIIFITLMNKYGTDFYRYFMEYFSMTY